MAKSYKEDLLAHTTYLVSKLYTDNQVVAELKAKGIKHATAYRYLHEVKRRLAEVGELTRAQLAEKKAQYRAALEREALEAPQSRERLQAIKLLLDLDGHKAPEKSIHAVPVYGNITLSEDNRVHNRAMIEQRVQELIQAHIQDKLLPTNTQDTDIIDVSTDEDE